MSFLQCIAFGLVLICVIYEVRGIDNVQAITAQGVDVQPEMAENQKRQASKITL